MTNLAVESDLKYHRVRITYLDGDIQDMPFGFERNATIFRDSARKRKDVISVTLLKPYEKG